MKINIKATGIVMTPSISDYVNKKLASLEKYMENGADAVAQVEVGKTTGHHKQGDVFRAEIHIIGAGLDQYAESTQEDLYAAIDIVKDEIANKILHFKGKREALTRRGARRIKEMLKGFNPFKKRS